MRTHRFSRENGVVRYPAHSYSTIYYPQSNVTGALRPHVHVDMNPSHGNSLMIYRPRVNASGMVNHTYSQWNPR